MALEAVVFSQDQAPITSYNCCKEYNICGNYNSFYSFGLEVGGHDFDNYSEIYNVDNDNNQWDRSPEVGNNYCSMEQQYDLSPPLPPATEGGTVADGGGGKRKRRRRSSKNREEVEHQRMTHIAVERNRRKQMNDYLAVIRSLMPPSYSQRGDQASIVGGAINYVKELEQLLQSLQAHKRAKQDMYSIKSEKIRSSDDDEDDDQPRLFGEFFNFPQYSSHAQPDKNNNNNNNNNNRLSGNEIEVTMVDGHANVRILAKKQQKQLLRLVAAFQALRLSVLHLNVTTLHPFVLYSFNLKVEEGCQLNSVDDVAAAANHILSQIQEEAAALLQ